MSTANKAAFPHQITATTKPGMSYRQWLIGQIAAGMAGEVGDEKIAAEWCVKFADAVIKAIDESES